MLCLSLGIGLQAGAVTWAGAEAGGDGKLRAHLRSSTPRALQLRDAEWCSPARRVQENPALKLKNVVGGDLHRRGFSREPVKKNCFEGMNLTRTY